MTRSYLFTKKRIWSTSKTSLGVSYWVLCTNLGDGVLCTLSLNHNIHREKWCLSAMDKMSFEVKKCVGNAFSRDLETQMLKFLPSWSIMEVPQGILTSQTVKKLSPWEKNGFRQKCLDKSLLCAYYILYFIIINGCESNKNFRKKTKLDKNWCSEKSRYLENGL